MGDIFSNVEGTEKNYNANIPKYALTLDDITEIDTIFHHTKDIGSFYDNDYCHSLEVLWHKFCYKHKLIVNKIRFESKQILYTKFNRKYEIGFNALWHLQNNQKIPIQCFKLEKITNKFHQTHSNWYIYIGLKSQQQRKLDIINHINTSYSFNQCINGRINQYIIDILFDYLPSNHIFNYKGKRALKLCKFTSFITSQQQQHGDNNDDDENMAEITESMMEINNLVKNKDNFMKIISLSTIKLINCDYDIEQHEILQFIKYLLFFFYHKSINKWIKSKCNYHSQQNKFMNNALIEVTNIWRMSSQRNRKLCHIQNIRVK